MKIINQIYVNGQFVTPNGTELFELINPSTGKKLGEVVLGNTVDARNAIAAAKAAFGRFSQSTVSERAAYLTRLSEAIACRRDDLVHAMLEEYGAPKSFVLAAIDRAIMNPLEMRETLEAYQFVRTVGKAKVAMEPVGVVGLITPWNANASFITSKLSTAIAAGCTSVIKPSEMSAWQTQVLLEAMHEAGLPPGVFNVVNGRGDVVGAEITKSKDIAKISFTGSTLVGKSIARDASETLKRVTLELGGKSANILLEDADLKTAIPQALAAAYMNNGQACIAGTRLLVPESRINEVKAQILEAIQKVQVGNPHNDATTLGPLVNMRQFERVQSYIQKGIDEGAELLSGGLGRPHGLTDGYFVKPTVFVGVKNSMTIAREEIFGPVLSVITYKDEDEAIEIANDTDYGLQSYITTKNAEKAQSLAQRLQTGRVLINSAAHEPQAPFGGFKQSGIGREYGVFGLETYLEPKSILGK